MTTRVLKLNCLSVTVLSALLIAVSVFLAEMGHTEYKSQLRKAKAKKIAKTLLDVTETGTNV